MAGGGGGGSGGGGGGIGPEKKVGDSEGRAAKQRLGCLQFAGRQAPSAAAKAALNLRVCSAAGCACGSQVRSLTQGPSAAAGFPLPARQRGHRLLAALKSARPHGV